MMLFLSQTILGLEGKVISIADGDTLTILTTQKQQVKVRLAGIDCPEKSQPYGSVAKQMLSGKVYGYNVKVKEHGKDQYGRTIGDVYLGDIWINYEMVKGGWAWHYKQGSKDKKIAQAEVEARKVRRGLWTDPNPVSPWEYRSPKSSKKPITGYWLNESTGVRHNSNCPQYKNTKRGRPCKKDEGRPGGCCGG